MNGGVIDVVLLIRVGVIIVCVDFVAVVVCDDYSVMMTPRVSARPSHSVLVLL